MKLYPTNKKLIWFNAYFDLATRCDENGRGNFTSKDFWKVTRGNKTLKKEFEGAGIDTNHFPKEIKKALRKKFVKLISEELKTITPPQPIEIDNRIIQDLNKILGKHLVFIEKNEYLNSGDFELYYKYDFSPLNLSGKNTFMISKEQFEKDLKDMQYEEEYFLKKKDAEKANKKIFEKAKKVFKIA